MTSKQRRSLPRIPWGLILFVTYVLVALDYHGTWVKLASWKRDYLIGVAALFAVCVALDALTRWRRRSR